MAENIPISDAEIQPGPGVRRFRRLVTGVNAAGQSYFVDDSEATDSKVIAGIEDYAYTNFWRAHSIPVDNSGEADDGLAEEGRIGPPESGAIFRVVQFAPDSRWADRPELEQEMYHSTASIDFAIVLQGEIWAVLDTEERLMRQGDVLIQRGTAHGWLNRTEEPAILAFVLIGGTEASSS